MLGPLSKKELQILDDFLEERNITFVNNYDMGGYSSWKVGATTKMIIFPENINEFKETILKLHKTGIDFFITGNATNTLFINLLRTIIISTKKLKTIEFIANNEIVADCGCSLSLILNKCLERSLVGFEFSTGIPGTVGGALITNAGANKGTISDCLKSVFFFKDEKEIEVPKNKIGFGYRRSSIDKHDVITRAKFKLNEGNVSLVKKKIAEYIKHRNDTQPVQYPSAGSVFMNDKQITAGKLIEELGLKGLTVGGAQVSNLHANYIINTGNANVSDIKDLIDKIKNECQKRRGINLETEVRIVDA